MTYNIYGANLEYKKGINGCWCVLAMTPELDAVKNSLLETLLINNNTFIDLIRYTDQPETNNVKLVLKITGNNG